MQRWYVMKKLKKIYTEHRIFAILMALVIVCFVLIGTVLIQCFYVGGNKDKYGNRLDGIEKVKLSESFIKDTESKLIAEEIVKKAEIIVTGKIVYISMKFDAPTTLVEAQSMAQKSLEYFKDEEKNFYDFMFTLREDSTENAEGFLISGSKNNNGSGLVWNNNNPIVEETSSEENGNGE